LLRAHPPDQLASHAYVCQWVVRIKRSYNHRLSGTEGTFALRIKPFTVRFFERYALARLGKCLHHRSAGSPSRSVSEPHSACRVRQNLSVDCKNLAPFFVRPVVNLVAVSWRGEAQGVRLCFRLQLAETNQKVVRKLRLDHLWLRAFPAYMPVYEVGRIGQLPVFYAKGSDSHSGEAWPALRTALCLSIRDVRPC